MKKVSPPVDDDGILVLRGEMFFRWKSADSEMRNAELSLKLKQIEVAKLLEQYPDVQRALDERTALVNKSLQTQTDLRTVYKDLEGHLGVEMTHVSIDDQTGRVYVLQDGVMGPMIPSKKKKPPTGARRSKSTK